MDSILFPHRFIYEETEPEAHEVQAETRGLLDQMSIDRDNNIGSGNEQMTPAEFLKKYEDLIRKNPKAFDRATAVSISPVAMDPAYFERLLPMGRAHFIDDSLRASSMVEEMLGKADYAKEHGDPALETTLRSQARQFVQSAAELYTENPVILVWMIDTAAERFPDLVDPLTKKIAPVALKDRHFAELTRVAVNTNKPDITRDAATSILFSSSEEPFQNIDAFKKIAQMTFAAKNQRLTDLILKRGKKFIDEDAQTKDFIEKLRNPAAGEPKEEETD